MGRRIFNGVSGLSLLLCLAAVSMWVRTFWRHDAVSFTSTRLTPAGWVGHAEALHSLHGELVWEHWRFDYFPGRQPPEKYRRRLRVPGWESRPARQTRIDLTGEPLGWAGIGVVRHPGATPEATYLLTTFAVPYWLLALLTFALPGLSLLRYGGHRYRRAFVQHACPICSYNLTGNVSGVCPECGTPLHREPAA